MSTMADSQTRQYTPMSSTKTALEFEPQLTAKILLDEWYEKFTLESTLSFMFKASAARLAFYLPWTLFFIWLQYHHKVSEVLKATFLLKTLTTLTGILISLAMKESMDRYIACLKQIINFRDEFRGFWYYIQSMLVDHQAGRYIFDAHMVAFALSALRFIDRQSEIDEKRCFTLVQEEMRPCILFLRQGMYFHLFGNPVHAEFLLVSWLRTLGVLDQDTRLLWQVVRQKLHALMMVRVRTPNTSKHLLRGVLHVFLIVLSVCGGEAVMIKVATPVICVVMFSLVKLAEELENPFGDDEHDLPIYSVIASVARINVDPSVQVFFARTIAVFNNACRTGQWDVEGTKAVFGPSVTFEPATSKVAYDSGKICLAHYLTLPDLERLDMVGYPGSPDTLFATTEHIIDSIGE
mmetsp:Transcript_10740/g.18857  ORF Transcript_10740/g.18857 Transcript_10740/m.18857 type:complete len:407 (+) Transcript_10740:88-1308(+)